MSYHFDNQVYTFPNNSNFQMPHGPIFEGDQLTNDISLYYKLYRIERAKKMFEELKGHELNIVSENRSCVYMIPGVWDRRLEFEDPYGPEYPPIPATYKNSLQAALKALHTYSERNKRQKGRIDGERMVERYFALSEDFNDYSAHREAYLRWAHLLSSYTKVDERFSALALVLRGWHQRIANDIFQDEVVPGYFLALMLVQYLQVGCSPPVLPCLHKMYPQTFKNNVWDTNALPDICVDFISKNKQSLAELLVGFFDFYRPPSDGGFDYKRNVISVKRGHPIPKERPTEFLDIECPIYGLRGAIEGTGDYTGPRPYGILKSVMRKNNSQIFAEIIGLTGQHLKANRDIHSLVLEYNFEYFPSKIERGPAFVANYDGSCIQRQQPAVH